MLDLQRHVIERMTDDDWDISFDKFDILTAVRADVTVKYKVLSGLLTCEDEGPNPSLTVTRTAIANGVESCAEKIVELIEMSNVKRQLDAERLPNLSATIVADDDQTKLFVKVQKGKSVIKSMAVYGEKAGSWSITTFTTMAMSIPSKASNNVELVKAIKAWYDEAPK